MKFRPLWLLIGIFFNVFYAYSQTDTTFLKKAIDSLDKKADDNPIEKIYLHLDRPAYDPGDTIWFKVYNLIGVHHRLSALSEVAYVELTGPDATVLIHRNIQLTAGTGWGDIAISRNFKQGIYHLRAYTNWMRNADIEYFFDKRIQIGQPDPSSLNKISVQPNPDVQFFPEGGELVNGIRSKIAVKAISVNGTGVNVNGIVIDNDGNTVAEFKSQHLGMAVFALTPKPGKTYKAKITDAGKTAFTVDLPQAIDKGYTLAINNSQADSIMVKVAVNPALFSEKQNSKFYIVAQSAGAVYYTAAGKLEQPVFTSVIAKKRFPSGIVQFTLFSEAGEPLNERIAFVQNNDTLKLKLTNPLTTFKTRQAVKIAFDAANNANKPAIGTFSAAVINETRLGVDETAERTILNNILLTSDLKGYVEKPNYYFINPNEQTNADLDLLMLTQGYRRFEWKQILNPIPQPITYRPEKALELSGTIKTPGGKPIANGKVTIMQLSQGLLKDTTADADGNFKFTGVELMDASKVVISALKPNGSKDIAIFIKQSNYPVVIKHQDKEIETAAIAEIPVDTLHQQKITEKHLGEVVIKGVKTSKPTRFNNYGTQEEHFVDMTRLSGYSSLKEALYANLGLTLLPHNIGADIDGRILSINDLAGYLPQEIERVGIIYSLETGRPAFIDVTTKRYAGTDTTVLKNVVIRARKINKGPDLTGSSNLNGPGNADQVLMGDKLSDCINLVDCLNGKLFGVMFKNGKPYNSRSIGRSKTSMILIVDGIIQDGSRLSELFANDIYSVEVLRSGAYLAIYGSNASGGALVITTKRGAGQDNYVSSDVPAGTITYPFKRFYKAKTFYSPKYKGNELDNKAMDLRNTIYWNPDLTTDKNGKASFEYFNADSKGTYKVVIEGIDADGNPGRKVYRYVVN